MPLNFGGQKRSGAFDTVWPSARNLVPPGHGSPQKQGRECVQLSLVRSNLPGSGAIQTPPTKGISLVATPIDVRSGSFGARLGGWFVAQRAPNRPKSTPTGPPTTSNCSRMSCSHHHHAEVLAQGLASLSTLHVSQKPVRKKASHNRCSTIACVHSPLSTFPRSQ